MSEVKVERKSVVPLIMTVEEKLGQLVIVYYGNLKDNIPPSEYEGRIKFLEVDLLNPESGLLLFHTLEVRGQDNHLSYYYEHCSFTHDNCTSMHYYRYDASQDLVSSDEYPYRMLILVSEKSRESFWYCYKSKSAGRRAFRKLSKSRKCLIITKNF